MKYLIYRVMTRYGWKGFSSLRAAIQAARDEQKDGWPSWLDWSLAYSYADSKATADDIQAMALAFGRISCLNCAHANVCTRSNGPEDICPEFMLASECEKTA